RSGGRHRARHAAELRGQQALVVPPPPLTVTRRLLAAAVCALALAPAAAAATTTPTGPVFDANGHLVQTPFAPSPSTPHLAKERALTLFEAHRKVATWLSRYPKKGLVDEETYDSKTASWTVKIWWGKAGEIAEGRVDDAS